jgi:hypothetical protein
VADIEAQCLEQGCLAGIVLASDDVKAGTESEGIDLIVILIVEELKMAYMHGLLC